MEIALDLDENAQTEKGGTNMYRSSFSRYQGEIGLTTKSEFIRVETEQKEPVW